MPQRPETIDTIRLAIELLRRIPRHRKVTASELHQQLQDIGLQRDLRSIQRQLEMLSEQFEIERDSSSKPYGYRWKEQAVGLALPMLSEQESMLLLMAQQQLSHLLPANLMLAMKSFFEQAHANLSPNRVAGQTQGAQARLSREWLQKVRVVSTNQPLLPPHIAPGVFEAVSNALYANQWLDIDYQNAKRQHTRARVMPLGLAQQGPRLYLVCRFEGYDNERSLALHRFISATATAFTFERPANFDLQTYDDDGRFGVGNGLRVKLKFTVAKGAGLQLLETPLSMDQTVEELADAYVISATVVETRLLHRWLRGFGDDVWAVDVQRFM